MTTMNIAGLTPVEDPSYRYQMPRLTAKIEGRGNGIKTVLMNVSDIGLSLNRDPAEVTKFFGCELGAQTTYNTDPVRAIVNGAHNAPVLQDHLSKYIENFVLCRNCRLPETVYSIKSGVIQQKCMACGNKDPCDMAHKLSSYIISQHKKAKEEKTAKADKKQRKEEKARRRAEEAEKGDGDVPETVLTGVAAMAVAGEPESPKKEKKEKKDKKEKKEKKDKKKKKDSSKGSSDGDEPDSKPAADVSSDDDETDFKCAEDAIEKLVAWKNGPGAGASTAEILDSLKTIHTLSGLRPADRDVVFLGAYLNENAVRENQVEANLAVLKALTPSNIHQRHLICATEWFCASKYPLLLPVFPILLKQMYDEDLLDEDTVLTWSSDRLRSEFTCDRTLISDASLDSLRAAAAPFCTWLEEAGVEGEESDEDDEEEDVDIDDI